MAYGKELAELGYAVICFDFPAFERRQAVQPNLQGVYGQEYEFHEAAWSGRTLMGQQVLETMSAVDVLYQREIKKVGVIGHSLGGTSSYYAAASDERITAVVASCGLGTLSSVSAIPYVHNPAWLVPGFKKGIGELHELCRLVNRPFLVSAGTIDELFPIRGVRDFIEWGKRLYRDPSQLELSTFAGGHSFPREAREKAYAFLDQSL